jgi:hypothetical protein
MKLKKRDGLLTAFALLYAFSTRANATENQFNLICSGTIKTEIIGDNPTYKDYNYEFRLDLDGGIYCLSNVGASCSNIKYINNSNEKTINLKNLDSKNGNEIIQEVEFFNRSTGVHYAHYISKYTDRTARMLAIVWEGSCEKLPFGGFPEFQKKF